MKKQTYDEWVASLRARGVAVVSLNEPTDVGCVYCGKPKSTECCKREEKK